MQTFEKTSLINCTPQELFDWHARPGALARLIPPWQNVRILGAVSGLKPGNRVYLRLASGPFHRDWIAEHTGVVPGSGFEDVQVSGPFKHWLHRHEFEPVGEAQSVLKDSVEFALPLGAIGEGLGGTFVRRSLEHTFAYRHRTTAEDLALHARYRGKGRLRVAVTGAGGLIGTTLTAMLTGGGHEVVRLTRSRGDRKGEAALWDPAQGLLETTALEGLDAVIHLAGDNISHGRWTAAKKARIATSRIEATQRLVESLSGLASPPRIFLGASAVGIYGDRGDEILTEESSSGIGFLAEVCEGWERAATQANESGIRTLSARFGVILSPQAGALARMLPAFRLGAGGNLGDGRQYMSWISVDDAAAALIHMLMTHSLSGPINVTSPEPVVNSEFTKILGEILKRPAAMPMPAPLARVLFGEMADATLLASNHVMPERLLASGFGFRHPDLRTALGHLLGRKV